MQTDPNQQPADGATAHEARTLRDLFAEWAGAIEPEARARRSALGEWALAVEHTCAAIEHARAVYGDLKAQLAAQFAKHARAASEARAAVRDQLAGRQLVITPDAIAHLIGAALGAVDADPSVSLDVLDVLDSLDSLAHLPGIAALVDAFTRADTRAPF